MESLFNLSYFVYIRYSPIKRILPSDIEYHGNNLKNTKIQNIKSSAHLEFIFNINQLLDNDMILLQAIKLQAIKVLNQLYKIIQFESAPRSYLLKKCIKKCCKYGNSRILKILIDLNNADINNFCVLNEKNNSMELSIDILSEIMKYLLIYPNFDIINNLHVIYNKNLNSLNKNKIYEFLIADENLKLTKIRQITLDFINYNIESENDDQLLIFQYYGLKEPELFDLILELGISPLKRKFQHLVYIYGHPDLIIRWYNKYGIYQRNYMWFLLRKDFFNLCEWKDVRYPGYHGDLKYEFYDIIDYIYLIGKKERKDIFDLLYPILFKPIFPNYIYNGDNYIDWCFILSNDYFYQQNKLTKFNITESYYNYLYKFHGLEYILTLAIKINDLNKIHQLLNLNSKTNDVINSLSI